MDYYVIVKIIMFNWLMYFILSTVSDDVRLVGGASHCTGRLEMKHQGEWRPVDGLSEWNQNSSAVVCRQLDCGSAVSMKRTLGFTQQPVWVMTSPCVGSESSLRECGTDESVTSTYRLEVICSGNKQ